MLTLHHFSNAWGLDPSPFCAKVQAYLRLAGIPWQSAPNIFAIMRAPHGKLPVIEDAGTIVADSHAIIAYLKRTYGDSLDAHLTPAQDAEAHLVTRMLEAGFYWVALYSRWIEPDAWRIYRHVLFSSVPAALRIPVAAAGRIDYRRRLRGLGLLRLPRDNVYAIGQRDAAAIATLIGERPYIFGDAPISLDATVYGFLGNVLYAPLNNPLKRAIAADPVLAPYLERLRTRIGLPFSPRPSGEMVAGG